jgi:hypothetical protein
MLPPLGMTGRASISDVTRWGGGCCASRAAGGGDLLLIQRGREAPRGRAAEFVHGFFSVCYHTKKLSSEKYCPRTQLYYGVRWLL